MNDYVNTGTERKVPRFIAYLELADCRKYEKCSLRKCRMQSSNGPINHSNVRAYNVDSSVIKQLYYVGDLIIFRSFVSLMKTYILTCNHVKFTLNY